MRELLRKPEPVSEESVRRYRQRLRNPQWKELEQHFNQAIPKAIKGLYERTEIIARKDIEVSNGEGATYHIAEFLPADLETLDTVWDDVKKSQNFPFGTDSVGDCYFVPLNDKSEECPVMCYHHDGSDFELVSSSLENFLDGIGKLGNSR